MWLLCLIFLQVPPERVELKVLDVGINPVPPGPPMVAVQDTFSWPEVGDIPKLIPAVGKAPELRRMEIPVNEVLYQSIASRTVAEYKEKVKNALRSGKTDRDVMLIKLELERTLLTQRLEMSKIEGKDDEVQKINRSLINLEGLMKTLEVEK